MRRQQTPQPPQFRAAAGLTGPATGHACIALIPIRHRHDSASIWNRRGVVAEFDLRAADRAADAAGHRHGDLRKADVVHHDRRPDDPLGHQLDRVPSVIQLRTYVRFLPRRSR